MNAAELPPRPVVVDHQIMGAQHAGISEDLPADFRNQPGIRRAAQQRIEGIPDQSESAVKDKDGDGEAHPPVKLQRSEMGEKRRGENRCR